MSVKINNITHSKIRRVTNNLLHTISWFSTFYFDDKKTISSNDMDYK